jgi:hypothetical protein
MRQRFTRRFTLSSPSPLLCLPHSRVCCSEELIRAREASERRQERKAREKEAELERQRIEAEGCTWGFAEDARDEDNDDDDDDDSGEGKKKRKQRDSSDDIQEGKDDDDEVCRVHTGLCRLCGVCVCSLCGLFVLTLPVGNCTAVQGKLGGMVPRTARQKQLLEAHRAEAAASKSAADEVHANDRKLFQKLEEKRDKIEKLKFEISRIRVKEWEDGLTAGARLAC